MYIGVGGIKLQVEDVNDCARLVVALLSAKSGGAWCEVDGECELESWGLRIGCGKLVSCDADDRRGKGVVGAGGVADGSFVGGRVECARCGSFGSVEEHPRDGGVGGGVNGSGGATSPAEKLSGGVGCPMRGLNYERNKANRVAQKARKQRRKELGQDWRARKTVKLESVASQVGNQEGEPVSVNLDRKSCTRQEVGLRQGFFSGCSDEVQRKLRESRASMLIAENDRIAEKAKRQLAVYKANDVEVEVKRYGTGVRASLERSMVSIEKTHGTLVATGNVPGEFHGSAETVVSASSGSISPSSSVSEAEVRKMQKDLLDRDAVIEKFEKRFGVQAAMLDYIDKDIWTENSENDRILDEFCPDGYAKDTSYTPEGKFRLIV